MNTDEFITALTEDSNVTRRFGRSLAAATMGGIVVAGVIFFTGVGVRPDFAQALDTGHFLVKFVVTITLAAMATGLISRIARPGTPSGWWHAALFVAPTFLGGSVIVELTAMPESTWLPRLVGTNASHCLVLIPLLSIAPLAFLLVALRQGAPEHPGLAGAIAGLAASGIAATFYALSCVDDSALFVATWYSIATAVVVLAGYLAGLKFLRW